MGIAKLVRHAGILRAMGLALLALLATNPPAAAAQLVDFSNVAFAQATGDTSIPDGAADFCRRYASECQPNAKVVDDIHLTPKNWQHLLDVNSFFNTTVVPETDEQLYQHARRIVIAELQRGYIRLRGPTRVRDADETDVHEAARGRRLCLQSARQRAAEREQRGSPSAAARNPPRTDSHRNPPG